MAKPIIAIEVENRYFVKLFDCEREASGYLNLTTVERRQKKALVKVFLIKNKNKIHLHTFTAERLAKIDAEKPKIDLKGKLDPNKKLELTLFLEGKQYSTKTVDIGRYLRTPLPALIGILLGIIAVLVLLFFFLFRENVFDIDGEAGRAASGKERQTEAAKGEEEQPQPGYTEEEQEEFPSEENSQPEQTSREEPSSEGPVPEEQTSEGALQEGPAPEGAPEGSGLGIETGGAETGDADRPETEKPEVTPPPAAELQTQQWTVYFNPDSARLTEEARQRLADIRNQLQAHPEGRVVISGHCALFGTERGRTELSQDRARTVLQYLLESSWDPEREPDVKGVGGKQSVTEERDKQYLNRRVEITISYRSAQ